MAVYKHKLAKHYTYDFEIETSPGIRERFRGSTDEATKREALKVEAKKRAEVEAVLSGRPLNPYKRLPEIRLREAFARFWTEKAQFEAASGNVFNAMSRMLDFWGPDKFLSQLTTDDFTRYQTFRRSQGVANRTTNMDMPETISRVLKRAKLWKVALPEEDFDWKELKLTLPKHRTRAGSRKEMTLYLRAFHYSLRPIIRFALLTGLRKAALIVRKSQVDWDNLVITYTKKSKHTGDLGWLPITAEIAKLLKREWNHHEDFVFTFVCQRSHKGRVKGQRYPVTYDGLSSAADRAVKRAGLTDWRIIHDLRHTAATNILRRSRNLAAVQGMLGHADIAQTSKYAHVLMDDVRNAMEA